MTLPPLREWWSELSDDAREDVLDSDSPHLGEAVREEIRVITGAVVGMVESLTEDDLAYARSHAGESG
ncbi:MULTISPECIES: hypothetical protein [unclassified Microbacterium]|uniref:hypothetical protein n=1 Tax=unclassified Microbacterium TaxID=2609290 RepID=UPI0016052950|nr:MULTISPECIES: hypothetical protein [unclassified Microbacterium]QNA92213.1 hypothetical protein G4G29_07050 [Microbacterium sp. Se63.02b]QYM65480.1 hypothetical protein K1X59_07110 [Microbacterium sp. Se5.02b]